MKTLAILSFNRTGSTVVGQCLAQAHNKDYIGEITNIPEVLMRYDNGRDVNVPYEPPLPEGTYVKTYDQIDGRIQRTFMYNDPKPFEIGTDRYSAEVDKRKQLLKQNVLNEIYSAYVKRKKCVFWVTFGSFGPYGEVKLSYLCKLQYLAR